MQTAQSFAARIAGRCPFSSPPRSFDRDGSTPAGSSASFPGRSRYLEAAFHSPETTACLQAPISRSKLPTCFLEYPPNPFAGPFGLTAPPHALVSPSTRGIATAIPLPAACPVHPAVPRISTPLRGLSNPSGSKRSTRFPAGKLTSRALPIASYSPASIYFSRLAAGSARKAR